MDSLSGQGGDDRFLTHGGDRINDQTSADVKLVMSNRTLTWTEREVMNVDVAFAELQDRTGSTRILKDTYCEGPLTFVKASTSEDWDGLNEVWWSPSASAWKRLIHVKDWAEGNSTADWFARGTAIHEIGHCWDSSLEGDYHPDGDDYWHDFKDLHRDSDGINDYVRPYGMESRMEDFCTCLEAAMGYITTAFPASPSSNLNAKVDVLDDFLDSFV